MKLTLTNIRKMKSESDNKLTKHVCGYVINRWHDYDDKVNIFKDVLYYGCVSGMVSELVWYSQTVAFYKKYRNEINEKLWQFNSMLVQVVVQSWRSPVYCLSASDFPCATAPPFFRTMPRSTSPLHQHIRI